MRASPNRRAGEEVAVNTDRYQDGLDALREKVSTFDEEDHEVAARAADVVLDQLDSESSILYGLDPGTVARTALSLTAILVIMKDGSQETLEHLDSGECEDPGCTTKHDEVDLDGFEHYINGLDTAIDALAGIALAVADRELGFDPDTVDWSNTSDWGKYDG